MQCVQNFSFYLGITKDPRKVNPCMDFLEALQKTNGRFGRVYSLFSKGVDFLDSVSNAYTDKIALPILKKGYFAAGELASRVSGLIDTSLKNRIEAIWVDPFSTEFVLRIGQRVQKYSHRIAFRKPSDTAFIHYFDTCLISSAQQLYAYAKEINFLLSIPQKLRNYVKNFSGEKFIQLPSIFLGKYWEWIGDLIIAARRLFYTIVDVTLKIAESILRFFTFNRNLKVIGYLRDIVKEAKKNIHQGIEYVARRVIHKKETETRKQVVANVSDYVSEYIVGMINRVILKTTIGASVFFTIKHAILAVSPIRNELGLSIQTAIIHSVALIILGNLMWKNVVKPTLDPFYISYNENFNGRVSTLKKICTEFCMKKFYYPLVGLRKMLQ